MPTIRIDAHEFQVERQRVGRWLLGMRNGVRERVKVVSFKVEARVKREMPVDTGRARASWGHFTPGDLVGNDEAGPGDAVWREEDGGLTLIQGTNVEYVEGLNEGNSAQAPAGFIDTAEEWAADELERELAALVDEAARAG